MKRVILVHGWSGNPNNAWFPWLRKKIEENGFEVVVPAMPHPDEPTIEDWIGHLKEVVKNPDKDTYFIGHSIGCQTIMRYLQALPDDAKIGGVIFVAGFFNLYFLKTEDEKRIAKPWLEIPINTEKIKTMTKNIAAIFSDNDPDVALSDKEIFEKRLGAKTTVEHAKGHFSDDAGVKELPVVLNELVKMEKSK